MWKVSHKSAQPGFNIVDLKNFLIPVPPIETQRKIVAILDLAEQLRQNRRQVNNVAGKIIQSVFLKVFGCKKAENKIGGIAVHVSSGSTPLGGERTYLKEGIVFIRSQNVLMNVLSLEDVAHISEKTHYGMKRTWLKNGDVLLNITGASLGRVAVYKGQNDQANVNQHVCIIRVDQSKALPEYVSFYLSTPRAQKQIWTIQAGASRQALNYKQVRSLSIFLPSMDEQSKFVTIVRKMETLRYKQAQSAKDIDELFNSLMQKAFKGEIALGKTGNRRPEKSHIEGLSNPS
jgi:type I restriction enzyme S subunit